MLRVKRVYEKAHKGRGFRVLVDRLDAVLIMAHKKRKKRGNLKDRYERTLLLLSDKLRKSFHHEAMKFGPTSKKKYSSQS